MKNISNAYSNLQVYKCQNIIYKEKQKQIKEII